jgi:hypothetical protein
MAWGFYSCPKIFTKELYFHKNEPREREHRKINTNEQPCSPKENEHSGLEKLLNIYNFVHE